MDDQHVSAIINYITNDPLMCVYKVIPAKGWFFAFGYVYRIGVGRNEGADHKVEVMNYICQSMNYVLDMLRLM